MWCKHFDPIGAGVFCIFPPKTTTEFGLEAFKHTKSNIPNAHYSIKRIASRLQISMFFIDFNRINQKPKHIFPNQCNIPIFNFLIFVVNRNRNRIPHKICYHFVNKINIVTVAHYPVHGIRMDVCVCYDNVIV